MDKRYISFSEQCGSISNINEFIEEKASVFYPEYDLFDFKVCFKTSSFFPYLVTVVLKKVEHK